MLKKKIAISALTALMGLSLVIVPVFAQGGHRGDHGQGNEKSGHDRGLHLGLGVGLKTGGKIHAGDDDSDKDHGNEGDEAPTLPAGKHLDSACAKTTITTRDSAVALAFDAWYTSQKADFQARHEAVLKAYDQADVKVRHDALVTARKAFQDAEKTAQKAWQDARSTASAKFKTDVQACVVANS